MAKQTTSRQVGAKPAAKPRTKPAEKKSADRLSTAKSMAKRSAPIRPATTESTKGKAVVKRLTPPKTGAKRTIIDLDGESTYVRRKAAGESG